MSRRLTRRCPARSARWRAAARLSCAPRQSAASPPIAVAKQQCLSVPAAVQQLLLDGRAHQLHCRVRLLHDAGKNATGSVECGQGGLWYMGGASPVTSQ